MSQNGFGFGGPIGPIPGLGGQGMNLTGTQRSPEERLSAYLKARATNPSMPLIPELETLARKQVDKTANASGRLGMAYLDSAEIQIAERQLAERKIAESLKAEAPFLEKTTTNLLGQVGGWFKKTFSGFGKKPEIAPADTVDANIIRNTRSALREATTQAEGSMADLAAAEARLQPPSLSERVSAGMGKLAASEEAIGQRLAKEAAAAAKKNQPTTGERVTGWLKNTLAGFGRKPVIAPADTVDAKIVRDTRQALLQTPTQAEGSMAALARFEEGLHSVAPATAAPTAVESTLSGGVSTRLRGALAPVKVPEHLPLKEQLAINHAAASGGFTPHPATGAWNVAEPVVEQKTGLIAKVTQWIETKAMPELSSRWEKLVAGVKHVLKPNPHSGAGEMEALMHHPEADRIAETLLDKAPQVHVPEVAAAPVTEAVTASAKKGGSLLGSLRERFNWKKPAAATVAETAAAPVERAVAPIEQAVEAVVAPVRGYVEPSQRILAQRAKTPNIHGEKEATIFKNIASHIGKNKGMYAVGAVGAAIVGAIAMSGNNKNRDAVLEREATGQDAGRAS